MSRLCPVTNSTVLYLDCAECSDKQCRSIAVSDTFTCIVLYPRYYADYCFLSGKLDKLLANQKSVCIISNEPSNVEGIIQRYAKERCYGYKGIIPDIASFGSEAGAVMLRKMCDIAVLSAKHGMIVFGSDRSQDTAKAVSIAKEYGIDCRSIQVL